MVTEASAIGTSDAMKMMQQVKLDEKGGEKDENYIASNQLDYLFDIVLGSADSGQPGTDAQSACRDHELLPHEVPPDQRRVTILRQPGAERERRQQHRFLRLVRSRPLGIR
jgi:hypothetical protein